MKQGFLHDVLSRKVRGGSKILKSEKKYNFGGIFGKILKSKARMKFDDASHKPGEPEKKKRMSKVVKSLYKEKRLGG